MTTDIRTCDLVTRFFQECCAATPEDNALYTLALFLDIECSAPLLHRSHGGPFDVDARLLARMENIEQTDADEELRSCAAGCLDKFFDRANAAPELPSE